ncbi:MAG: arsenite methyltransferase [Anaerolineaceae bacterium]|nr:arsenite methyltransferase [Anaerolineaceae bacterium]
MSESIHQAVRENYGRLAEAGGACCGSDSACTSPQLYDEAQWASLPKEAAELSLGCGDPVTIAGLRPGEHVLDLGSGGGIDCFLAAEQVGPAGHVIGVDMTPAMLERARATRDRLGLTQVEFRQGQLEALPVADETIDVILSNCVISLVPDKGAAFREAFRVLKVGGRISVSDIVTGGEFSAELRADLNRWTECVSGAVPLTDYLAGLSRAGFVEITVVSQVDASDIVPVQEGMPPLFSVRIRARKQNKN